MDRGALDKFRASTGFGMGNVQNEDTRRRNDMYSTFDSNQYSQRPSNPATAGVNQINAPSASGPTMPSFNTTPPHWQLQMYRNLGGRQYYGPGQATPTNPAGLTGIGVSGAANPANPSAPSPQSVWGANNLPAWAQNVQQNYNNMRNPQFARQFFGSGRRFGGVSPTDPGGGGYIGPVPPPEF